MNIAEVLVERAAESPDRPAIVERRARGRRVTSFAQLERQTACVAASLAQAGVTKGATVFLLHPIAAELYAGLLGVLRAGATAMLLDPSAGLEHVARCCAIRPPDVFLASRKAHLLRLASASLRRVPLALSLGGRLPLTRFVDLREVSAAAAETIASCEPDDPALITFTSGSTGAPKAAVRTHGFLMEQNRVLAKTLGLHAGQLNLITLPVFVLANLAAGVTSIIPDCDLRRPGHIDPHPVLRQIDEEQPESSAGSPAFYARLVEAARAANRRLMSFRRIDTGGAPVTVSLLEAIAEVAPRAVVSAVYGSTEAEPIAELSLRSITVSDRKRIAAGGGLPAGHPVEEISLIILEDQWGRPLGSLTAAEFQRRQKGPEEPGEIVVSGKHVLKGYLHGVGDEETKFDVDGRRWHRTGDAGYLDADGRLWLLGRCGGIVRDTRGTLYPFAVEVVAQGIPGVARAGLLAHEARRLLFVEAKAGHALDALRVREELAWAQLDEVRILDRLPLDRRHNAKIDYPKLKELAK